MTDLPLTRIYTSLSAHAHFCSLQQNGRRKKKKEKNTYKSDTFTFFFLQKSTCLSSPEKRPNSKNAKFSTKSYTFHTHMQVWTHNSRGLVVLSTVHEDGTYSRYSRWTFLLTKARDMSADWKSTLYSIHQSTNYSFDMYNIYTHTLPHLHTTHNHTHTHTLSLSLPVWFSLIHTHSHKHTHTHYPRTFQMNR